MFSAARSGSEGRVGSRGSGSPAAQSSRPPPNASERALLVLGHRRLDRDLDQLGAEVGGDIPRVRLCFNARMRRGHHHAADVLGAERVDGEQGDEGGVDAAREGDADVAEAVLAHVVAQAEGERRVDLGEVGQRLGEPARARGRGPRRPAAPPRTGPRGRSPCPRGRRRSCVRRRRARPGRRRGCRRRSGRRRRGRARRASLRARAPCRGGTASPRGWRSGSRPPPPRPRPAGPAPRRPRRRSGRPACPATSTVAGSVARDEVALLVEDRVVGQPVLAVDGAHGAVGEHRERVVGVAEVAVRRRPARRSRPGRRSPRPRAASSSTARRLASTKWRFR